MHRLLRSVSRRSSDDRAASSSRRRDEVPLGDSLGRALVHRLDEEREAPSGARASVASSVGRGARRAHQSAVGTPWARRISFVRALSRQSESVNGSLPEYGMPKNSQIAGTCASRFGPRSPSAMLKTMSGRSARRRCGKVVGRLEADDLAVARRARRRRRRSSRRSPTRRTRRRRWQRRGRAPRARRRRYWAAPRRRATAPPRCVGASGSGFWLYANPMRVIPSLVVVARSMPLLSSRARARLLS